MADIRDTQNVLEDAEHRDTDIRDTQDVLEHADHLDVNIRTTQDVMEVGEHLDVNIRSTQNLIEIAYGGYAEGSYAYFGRPIAGAKVHAGAAYGFYV